MGGLASSAPACFGSSLGSNPVREFIDPVFAKTSPKRSFLITSLFNHWVYKFGHRHLSKIQNRRHKQRSGQHTLARQKNIQTKVSKEHTFMLWLEMVRFLTNTGNAATCCKKRKKSKRDRKADCHIAAFFADDR
jgi:hypothetical protein